MVKSRRKKNFGSFSMKGFDNEQLNTLVQMFEAEKSDIFDVLAYLSFERQMITREERVEVMEKDDKFFNHFDKEPAQDFLHFILNRYQRWSSRIERDRLGNWLD